MQTEEQTEQPKIQTLGEVILHLASGQAVVADGTLAEQCATVLLQAYGKAENDVSNLSMESHQVDLQNSIGRWEALKQLGLFDVFESKADIVAYVYAVREGDVEMADAIRFVDALQTMQPEQQAQSALLIEGGVAPSTNPYAQTMIQAAEAYGAKVLTDMADLKTLYKH